MKKELATSTLSRLQQYIYHQNEVGEKRLPSEKKLSEELGVGRSTLREAIKILSYSGMVKVIQGSGTYITDHNIAITDEIKLRKMQKILEYEAIRELIEEEQSADAWYLLKKKLNDRNFLFSEGKLEEYIDADIIFHTQIIQMAHNPYLKTLYQSLNISWKAYLTKQIIYSKDYKSNSKEHSQLVTELQNKRAQAAIKIISHLGEQKGDH